MWRSATFLVHRGGRGGDSGTDEKRAEQGARANDHGRHASCSEQHESRRPRSWLILNVRRKKDSGEPKRGAPRFHCGAITRDGTWFRDRSQQPFGGSQSPRRFPSPLLIQAIRRTGPQQPAGRQVDDASFCGAPAPGGKRPSHRPQKNQARAVASHRSRLTADSPAAARRRAPCPSSRRPTAGRIRGPARRPR